VRFFLQAPVAHLHVAKLALDHTKRVLDLGAHARLAFFKFVDERVDGVVDFVQLFAPSKAHGNASGNVRLGIRTFFATLIASIGIDNRFLPVQQRVAFGDIGHITSHAAHGVH